MLRRRAGLQPPQHESMPVLADHVRDAELFRDHAGDGFVEEERLLHVRNSGLPHASGDRPQRDR